MKKTILLLLIISSSFLNRTFAQQIPIHSQYMFNSFLLNPAICGTTEENRLFINARNHMLAWGGGNSYNYNIFEIDPNPLTSSLSFNKGFHDRMSWGFNLMYDRILPITTINLEPTFAHRSRLFDNLYLSLGISTPVYYTNFDNGQVQWLDPDQLLDYDMGYVSENETGISGSANFGLYLFNDRFDFGFSVKNIWESEINGIPNVLSGDATTDELINTNIRHYYLHSSYDFQFDWASSWAMVPTILLKTTELTKPQVDLNLKLIYMDFMWVGTSFRKSESVITAMLGINLQYYFFGYSYDISTSPLATNYSVAHGITIGRYFKNKNDHQNVRKRNRFFEDRSALYWYPDWL